MTCVVDLSKMHRYTDRDVRDVQGLIPSGLQCAERYSVSEVVNDLVYLFRRSDHESARESAALW